MKWVPLTSQYRSIPNRRPFSNLDITNDSSTRCNKDILINDRSLVKYVQHSSMPRKLFFDVATLETRTDAINGLSSFSNQLSNAVYRSSEGSHFFFFNQFLMPTLFEVCFSLEHQRLRGRGRRGNELPLSFRGNFGIPEKWMPSFSNNFRIGPVQLTGLAC